MSQRIGIALVKYVALPTAIAGALTGGAGWIEATGADYPTLALITVSLIGLHLGVSFIEHSTEDEASQ